LLSCTAPTAARADDLRFHALWLGPTFSLPLTRPRRAEWGGALEVFMGYRDSRIGFGFDLGATNERFCADALVTAMLSDNAGVWIDGGPVAGYGAVDGLGARAGVAGFWAPFGLPLVLNVNAIDMRGAPLQVLGTVSIQVGGGT
jgi:hypothetical protein